MNYAGCWVSLRLYFQDLMAKAKALAQCSRFANSGLSPLYFFTDPVRVPDPISVISDLPEGACVVWRHFSDNSYQAIAEDARQIAKDRGLIFIVGNDLALAHELVADGVHFSESQMHTAKDLDWMLKTCAIHSKPALLAAQDLGFSALFISPVFESLSPSATHKPSLGVDTCRQWASLSHIPLIGLGGIDREFLSALKNTGLYGIAAIDLFIRT